MRSKILSVCAIAVLASTPALASGNAASGLQALKELNLTVLGTLTANGQEVEGRTFAGTLNASNWTNFGVGRVGQGSSVTSAYDVLDLVNNANGSWRLKAGYANGSNATPLGNTAVIGGSVYDVDFNDANGQVGSLTVGGNLNNHLNVNNHLVTYGGSNPGGSSPVTQDASLAIGGAHDVQAALSLKLSALTADLTALSDLLYGLAPAATVTNTNSALNWGLASNNYLVVTMTQAAFEDQNANFDNLFSGMPNGVTTIINVLGSGSLTERGNINATAANQNVIWNFRDATSLSLKGFHGSVLAVNADVTNSSAIEGSIVAKNFTLNGEVHLGTYGGTSNFLPPAPPAVPEPASWAMMLTGFGAVGAAMRRRSRAVRFA